MLIVLVMTLHFITSLLYSILYTNTVVSLTMNFTSLSLSVSGLKENNNHYQLYSSTIQTIQNIIYPVLIYTELDCSDCENC